DVRDRLLELAAAPGSRRHAELAGMGAGPRRLEDRIGDVLAAAEEIAARDDELVEVEVRGLGIALLQSSGVAVSEQPRPGLLGIADADRVAVGGSLVRHERHMWAAEHDGDSRSAEPAGELIGARRR